VRRRLNLPAISLSLAAQQRTPPLFPRSLGGTRRNCEFFEIEILRLDVQFGYTQRLVEPCLPILDRTSYTACIFRA
jgi:hypothetical protein